MPGDGTFKKLHLFSLQKRFGCDLIAVKGPLCEEESKQ